MASIEPNDFKEMCFIREVETIKAMALKIICEIENSSVVRKSIVYKETINIGDEFTEDNLAVKRPATEFHQDIGKI